MVRYQGLDYFIKGRMSTGYAILMDIHGNQKDLDHIPKMKEMQRVKARTSCLIASEQRILETTPSLGEVSLRIHTQGRNSSAT